MLPGRAQRRTLAHLYSLEFRAPRVSRNLDFVPYKSDDAGTLSWAKWSSGMDSARNLARNCYPIRLKWTQSTLVYEHSPTKRPCIIRQMPFMTFLAHGDLLLSDGRQGLMKRGAFSYGMRDAALRFIALNAHFHTGKFSGVSTRRSRAIFAFTR